MLEEYRSSYWATVGAVHRLSRDTYQWVSGITRRVRDEHNAILSLSGWDLKGLAVGAFATTVLSSNLDFLSRGNFVVFVLHCEGFPEAVGLRVSGYGNWGRGDAGKTWEGG